MPYFIHIHAASQSPFLVATNSQDELGFGTQASLLTRRIEDDIRASASTQTSAAARFPLLTGGSWNNPMTIQTDRRIATDRDVNLNAITPGFFATLGIRVGRRERLR